MVVVWVVWGLLVLLGLEVVELVGEVWEVGVKVAVGVVVEMVEEGGGKWSSCLFFIEMASLLTLLHFSRL